MRTGRGDTGSKKWLARIVCAGLLLVPGLLQAQEVKVDYDEQCGCDIFYVDGIETTRDGDRYGFRREDGTVIAPNIYRFVGQFNNGYCKVLLDYNQTGLIDSTGRQVVPCIYQDVEFPSEGRVLVVKDNRFGFTDLDGNVVIEPQYLQAGSYNEGCAPVLVSIDSFFSACTFIDTLGNMLFPPKFQNLQPFTCGHALVRLYERWGMIDHSGRMVMPTVFEQMTTLFGDTLFFAGDDDGMALYNSTFKPLTKAVYTNVGALSDGRIPVCRDGKYGFLDTRGHEVIPCKYDEVGFFHHARAKVRLSSHYGIIDTTGRYVLPVEYDYSQPKSLKYVYYDSLALVEKGGRFGYVDLEGRVIIPICFEDAYQFSDHVAPVRYNGRWGYVDTRGNSFLPFVFDLAAPFEWGRAEVYYQGEPRQVDLQGRCVKNCKGTTPWKRPNE